MEFLKTSLITHMILFQIALVETTAKQQSFIQFRGKSRGFQRIYHIKGGCTIDWKKIELISHQDALWGGVDE